MTVGPWRPICFHTYDIRIAEVWANAIVSEKLEPRLELSFELAGDEFTGTVQAFVRGPGKASIKEAKVIKVTGGKGSTTYTFDDDEIALWYPVGSGKQPLYEIEVVAIDDVSTFQHLPAKESHDVCSMVGSWILWLKPSRSGASRSYKSPSLIKEACLGTLKSTTSPSLWEVCRDNVVLQTSRTHSHGSRI
jgi:hypothetical protein